MAPESVGFALSMEIWLSGATALRGRNEEVREWGEGGARNRKTLGSEA